jgi:ATP-dependent Clp protease ATP-binding subunit ClpA
LQNTDQKVEVTGPHLIVSLFAEKDSHALYFLTRQGLSRLDVVDYLAHGTRKDAVAAGDAFATQTQHGPEVKKHESALAQYAEDLNQSAREGKIDPLIGRDAEVHRVMQILCRRRKNNPLLVGEAGVGKTAIAEGLALAVVEGKAPEALKNLHVFSLDMGSMLAGAKYRGDFEKRLKDVIKELEKIPNSLVFIDEIHTVIGAGAASGGALDAANILKPTLARGSLRCMGATTYQEYRNVFEKYHALARRFQ